MLPPLRTLLRRAPLHTSFRRLEQLLHPQRVVSPESRGIYLDGTRFSRCSVALVNTSGFRRNRPFTPRLDVHDAGMTCGEGFGVTGGGLMVTKVRCAPRNQPFGWILLNRFYPYYLNALYEKVLKQALRCAFPGWTSFPRSPPSPPSCRRAHPPGAACR